MSKKATKITFAEYEADNSKLVIKKTISSQDLFELVKTVVESCIIGGTYFSIAKEIVFVSAIVDNYTNIKIGKKATDTYDKVVDLGLFDVISEKIDETQFAVLIDAIEDDIAYRFEEQKNNALASNIETIMCKFVESFTASMPNLDDANIAQVLGNAVQSAEKSEAPLESAIIDE